jgi:putative nucleotidyltransferase with HDIG domain
MLTRDQAYQILQDHIKGQFMINHHLGAEAVMRAFAAKFNEDPELWGICGLLHDLDWEYTKDAPHEHTKKAAEILRSHGVDEVIIHAVQAHHPSASGVEPSNLMEQCLYTTEELTGLMIACALVQPDKKLASVKAPSVFKKLKTKGFAKGVNRDIVNKAPEVLQLSMEEVIRISLEAMQGIAGELGL